MRTVLLLVMLCGLTAAFATNAPGQVLNASMTVSNTSTTFPNPSVANFDAGYVGALTTTDVTVKPDPSSTLTTEWWYLYARVGTTPTGGGSAVIREVWVSVNGGAWVKLTTTNQLLYQDIPERTVTISYRTGLDYALDAPNNYGVDIIFYATH